ncbi:MAG: hypothetical protein M3146_08040 [Thermoproteota archaeon]|nr:hypothetical protein [Thermoproteota archaeon]
MACVVRYPLSVIPMAFPVATGILIGFPGFGPFVWWYFVGHSWSKQQVRS